MSGCWPPIDRSDRMNPRVSLAVEYVVMRGLDPKVAAEEAECSLGTLHGRLKRMALRGEIGPEIYGPDASSRRQSASARLRHNGEPPAPFWWEAEMAS